jgi:hypothetical protein
MPTLDIFGNSAFSVISLTDAINKVPFVPGRIGQLGLFDETGIVTTSVMIEEREGSLNLIETSSRGSPAAQKHEEQAKSTVVYRTARCA